MVVHYKKQEVHNLNKKLKEKINFTLKKVYKAPFPKWKAILFEVSS